MKSYKLNTISDIIDVVTSDNIDTFISDFRLFLEMRIEIAKLANEDVSIEMPTEFDWTDDNIKGLTELKIQIK